MSIYKKLFEAKKEIGKISKDSTNPFYKSKYFDINSLLEHVEPILQKHGLLLLQPIKDGKVITVIQDVDQDGNLPHSFFYSELELTNQPDPQKRGSEITYYRRYTLQSLLGLQAEDDDANATVKSSQAKEDSSDLKWLNRMTGKELSRDWNRALATLKDGKDVTYLRTKFKISKENEQLLIIESKK